MTRVKPKSSSMRSYRCASLALLFVISSTAVTSQSSPPQRIISLIPAVTEILFAIGAGSQVIGVSNYDVYPPAATQLPRVGGLIDPAVEIILSLQPDLVIAYETQFDLLKQLTNAGINVSSYTHGTLDHILAGIRSLGVQTGHATRAEQVARQIESDLQGIRARVAGRNRPRTLFVFAKEPLSIRNLFANGGKGFHNEMLEIAGSKNVFADTPRPSVQASTETILARAPEVIIEVRAGNTLKQTDIRREIAVWNLLPSLPAVQTGRVYFLQGTDLVVPGPRIAMATERLARALHPDAFKQ